MGVDVSRPCQNKACEHYRLSIRREKLEGEFEALLRQFTPSGTLFKIADAMFRDNWNQRATNANGQSAYLKFELRKIDHSIEQFLDHAVAAESRTLVTAYEARIEDLEQKKIELRERIASCGRPVADFDTHYRTAMDFLASPWKLWESDDLNHKPRWRN